MTSFKVGDIVRVKDDAYSEKEVSRIHNGRICQVIEISGGDVVVRSIDKLEPVLERTYHSPYVLEIQKGIAL